MIDWELYPNFSEQEFACKHTGDCLMKPEFLSVLQSIRDEYGKPMFISSGYRSPSHPVEEQKDRPGEHSYGLAADITVMGMDALELIDIALGKGVRRIGVHQKGRGSSRFIHLGIGEKFSNNFQGAIWTY